MSSSPDSEALERIVALASGAAGVAFHQYKPPFVERRVLHCMRVSGAPGLPAYAELLARQPSELFRVIDSLFIPTTEPFRGRATFAALRESALPALVARRRAEHRARLPTLRAWVAACSTGDEAWSLAMCLLDAAGRADPAAAVHVLATDVSSSALERAARGELSAEAARAVPPELAARFLVESGGRVRVGPEVLGAISFVRHDLLDPHVAFPTEAVFASFDLVSCRNLLIYLDNSAQLRVAERLLAASEPGGLLLLDESESPPGAVGQRLTKWSESAAIWRVD